MGEIANERVHDTTGEVPPQRFELPHGGVLKSAEVVLPRTLLKNPLQGSLGP
jgi:hypothetical protein